MARLSDLHPVERDHIMAKKILAYHQTPWVVGPPSHQPGHRTTNDLLDWFWLQTALGRLIGAVAEALTASDDHALRGLATRALVPRSYIAQLIQSDPGEPQ